MYYHIGECLGYCSKKLDQDKVDKMEKEILSFLRGNDKILKEGNTFDILTNVNYLKKNKIDIPDIVEITYLALKNKKVKIDYHKDIRDIIKDIYKHV